RLFAFLMILPFIPFAAAISRLSSSVQNKKVQTRSGDEIIRFLSGLQFFWSALTLYYICILSRLIADVKNPPVNIFLSAPSSRLYTRSFAVRASLLPPSAKCLNQQYGGSHPPAQDADGRSPVGKFGGLR